MAKMMMVFPPILIVFLLSSLLTLTSCFEENQVHIVYFGEHSGEKTLDEIEQTHHSYLLSVKETEEEARDSLIYSYKHSINGFAAVLTPHQASKLSELEEVVSVFVSHPHKHIMHTTRSWEFVGLEEEDNSHVHIENGKDLLIKAKYGKDIIVGVIDSGFWPESKSFNDKGMGPIPKSWKGICQTAQDFNSSHCNRKVIGARYYSKAYLKYYNLTSSSNINAISLDDFNSPVDHDGHGTHTASTVGGRRVPKASFMNDLAKGTASGGAPLVRLAIYKACWAIPNEEKVDGNTCFDADMLAAIDDAILDGVHVLSISIGTKKPIGYERDGIAIGSLHAVKKDIVVSCSAGNSGPSEASLSNIAPWIITVGASSVDRSFTAPVVLGNGNQIEGETVTPYKLEADIMYPLVHAAEVEHPHVTQILSGQCLPGSLSPTKAKGKIVLCFRGNGTRIGKGFEVKRANAVGLILANTHQFGQETAADPHVLPATAVGYNQALQILSYIDSSKTTSTSTYTPPTAKIIPAKTVLQSKPAPFMASFTSRGPNIIDPNILKPDITAPGLNILAAWTGFDSPTKLSQDKRRVEWMIYSGTSMSCPHVSAAAALLKAIHPSWTSAAIRSALITTAGLRNNNGTEITDAWRKPANSFQFGAGHFRPAKAADPGLIYDATYKDYLQYLCGRGIASLDPTFTCPKNKLDGSLVKYDLNYPSIAVVINSKEEVKVKRTVTNVGAPKSVYSVSVKQPLGYKVKIHPTVLVFNRVGQKKSFTVTVFEEDHQARVIAGKLQREEDHNKHAFGWITWFDGIHSVRSPMVVSSPLNN